MKKVFIILVSLIACLFASCAKRGDVKFAVVYGAAHGKKCFSTAAVVVNAKDGSILDAFIDEYQYFSSDTLGLIGVPNSDKKFANGHKQGLTLASKKVNDAYYSAHMQEKAASTVSIKKNYETLEAFVEGKKSAELSEVDIVSGATLVDTPNYMALIAKAAERANASEVSYPVSNLKNVSIAEAEAAAHGEQCFALVVNVMDGSTIAAAFIDEFQYMDAAAGVKGVPNSDKRFGENYVSGKLLCSKKENAAYYSATMASLAGSTISIDENYRAIENFAQGKKPAALAEVDAVTGATLVDTPNYLRAIAFAAENSK